MPWFLYPCQAAGGVLALEAYQVVRASSVFDGLCPIEPPPIHVTPFSVFKAMVVIVLW